MKFVFTSILYILSILCCLGQSGKIDSLKTELKKDIRSDSLKIHLLLDLAFEFRFTNPDSMRYYANNARLLGLEVNNSYGELQGLRNIALAYLNEGNLDTANNLLKTVIEESKHRKEKKILLDAYNSLGRIFYNKADYDSAIYIFELTLELSNELNAPVDRAGAMLNIGGSLQEKGVDVKATRYFNDALLIFDSLNNQYGVAIASYNLANIFKNQGDYDKSLLFFNKVAKIDSLSGNVRDFASTLGSIADLLLYKKDTLSAISQYRRSIALYDSSGANCKKVISINNLGDLFLQLNQLDSAKKYLDESFKLATDCEMPKQIASIYYDMGKYDLKIDDKGSAKINFQSAFEIASKHSLKKLISDAALKLYSISKENNNLKEALFYLENARSIEKELFNQDNTRKIAQIEAEYEMEKERQKFQFEQEKSNLEYQESISGERSLKYQILFGFIILSILLVIILSLYFQKNKLNYKLEKILSDTNEQNQQIKEQNEEISQQTELLERRSYELEHQKKELEDTNNKLTQLNEEKNTIIGIVAHDLKSPLNQVKGFISLLKLEQNNPDKIAEYLKMLEEATNRSTSMIDRILDINAIDNQSIVVNKKLVKIRSLFESIKSDYQEQSSKKEIELKIELDDEIVLQSDPEVLQEVIDNLVSNAIKFSPSNTYITMSAKEYPNFYSLSVKDNGPGIAEDDKSKIFKKYEQGSAQPTANEKSTGLGLAIVKRYIDALQYEIECVSDGKKGTTFIVKIPK